MERIEAPVEKVWIGSPIANARVHILDDQRLLVPIGVVGEIAVSGPVVGLGYVNDPALSNEVFVENPYATHSLDLRLYLTGDLGRRNHDGKIEYLGRKDQQVKIRGLRIELDDIASAMREFEGIEDAAVIAHNVSSDQLSLIAFYVPKCSSLKLQETHEYESIRRHLLELLPSYMIPDHVVAVDCLPLNSNGKVDRRKLVKRVPDFQANGSALSKQTELALAKIWSTLLGVEQADLRADSDFFAIGGHSLLGIRLVTLLEKQFGVSMPVRDIFDHRDINDMSSQIDLLVSQKAALELTQALTEQQIEKVEF
jgi:acyl carrier protein